MYMTFRNMKADPAKMQDAIGLLQHVAGRLNSEHGGNFAVSNNVGGDPTMLSISSPWASLADYEAARASMMADAEIQSAIRMAAGLVTGAQDTIGKIRRPSGDRGAYAFVNVAMMNISAIGDAVALALEIAEYVSDTHGNETGVITAVTGPRAGLMWLGMAESMAHLETLGDALEADPHYMEFFKRSEGLFLPSTLEASIWQML